MSAAVPTPRAPAGGAAATAVLLPQVAAPERQSAAVAVRSRGPLTWRSLLVGLAAVVFVCGLTPYNDFVVHNTFLVGNYLPVGLLLFVMAVVFLLNAPLNWIRPRWALGAGEMAVILGMGLVACTLPTSGLMRYLPAALVGIQHHAGANADYRSALEQLNLPDWLFPTFATTDVQTRTNEAVITNYWNRVPAVPDSFSARWRAVPWNLWARPAVTWGILIAAFYGAIMCLSVLLRQQWSANERLPFPLASVYLSLIEPAEPGHLLNGLFRARSFWIAAAFVFVIHLLNGLHTYYPATWPLIPLRWEFWSLFGDPPWSYMHWSAKASTLYFCIVGITFFIQTKIAFSLWGTYVLVQIVHMLYGSMHTEFSDNAKMDQQFGALFPIGIAMLWVGRKQWLLVLRQMVRGTRFGEDGGRYLPNAVAGWGMLLCCAAVVVWLMAAGTTLIGALVIVALMLLVYAIAAKVVAETGIVFVQFNAPLNRVWVQAMTILPAARTTPQTMFFTNWFDGSLAHDTRESLSPYATTAMQTGELADDADGRSRRNYRAIGFFVALLLALAVGYVVSGVSTLYAEYNYAVSLDGAVNPINPYGTDYMPEGRIMKPTHQYMTTWPQDSHSRPLHLGIGAGITTLLSIGRFRFAGWPLHPVGFLLVYSYPMSMIWFSIFVGWLAKVLVVKFGGIDLFRSARALFIGLIIGEAGAATFWLVVTAILSAMGSVYKPVILLPT